MEKKYLIGTGIFIVLLIAAFVFLQPTLQSIIGVSQVKLSDDKSLWVANLSVNSNDTIEFKKENMDADYGAGQKIKAQSSVKVNLSPLNPVCNYQLTNKKYNFNFLIWNFSSVDYYQLSNSKLSVPYSISVQKIFSDGSTKIINPDGSITSFYGLPIPAVTNIVDGTQSTTTLTFTDSSTGGKLYLQNLGALQGDVSCPPSSGAVLVPVVVNGKVTEYKLLNETEFRNKLDSFNNNLLNGASLAQVFFSNPTIGTASQFNNIEGMTVAASNLKVTLPKSAYFANVTVSMETKFVDSVIYTPSKGKPKILSFTSTKTSFNQTDSTQLKVQVKNEGTADVFDFVISSKQGRTSFNQTKISESFTANETKTITFSGYGFVSGSDEICIKVASTSIFSESDSKCLAINVLSNPSVPATTTQPVQVETPLPDVIEPEQTSTGTLTCPEGYHLNVSDEPVWWTLGLLKNTSTECQKDFPIEIALIIVSATIIIAIILWKKLK